jgi:hypothetical protein
MRDVDLPAETALGANAVAIADEEHPDHEFGIDRGPPDVAVHGSLRS